MSSVLNVFGSAISASWQTALLRQMCVPHPTPQQTADIIMNNIEISWVDIQLDIVDIEFYCICGEEIPLFFRNR